jgi:uracil-DNA glycosylase family 4
MNYDSLVELMKSCNACKFREWSGVEPLAPERVSVPVSIMFLGENPSWAENQTVPFSPTTISGKALKDHYLDLLEIRRDQVWITDLFKCRYPRERKAVDIYHAKSKYSGLIQKTVETCTSEWLLKEIEIARPSILVTLSNTQVYQRLRKAFKLKTPKDFHEAAGCPYQIQLGNSTLNLFPMVHPDVSRPPGDGDNRKLEHRRYWSPRHRDEHIPALKRLVDVIRRKAQVVDLP